MRSCMQFLKGLVVFSMGVGLIVAGVAAQIAWLAFCFGTIVIGILLLIFARHILLLPFLFLCVPGLRVLNNGLVGMTPKINPERAAALIAPIVMPQVAEVEAERRRLPTDYRLLAYVMALSQVATKRGASINDGMSILKILFADKPQYKHSIANIYFEVVPNNIQQLWEEFDNIKTIAAGDVATGGGMYLMAEAYTPNGV